MATGLANAANQYYQSPLQGYFPGQTIAGFTPYQQQAWGMGQMGGLAGIGGAGRYAQAAGQGLGQYNAMLGQTQNPYAEQYGNALVRNMTDTWAQTTRPGLTGDAVAAGQSGSSRHGVAEGLSRSNLQNQIGQHLAGYYGNVANNAMGQQTQRLGMMPGMLGAYGSAMQAPGTALQNYGNILGQIGGSQQGMNQARLNQEMDRWNYLRDQGYGRLQNYGNVLSTAGGMAGGAGTTTNPNPNYVSPLQGAMGGLMYGLDRYGSGLFGNTGGSNMPNDVAQAAMGQT